MVKVAFARFLMSSVDAPEVPASPEVLNGSVRRQHSSAELFLLSVTMAVASRKVPFVGTLVGCAGGSELDERGGRIARAAPANESATVMALTMARMAVE